MPFTPPAFEALRKNTLNLDAKLSTLLGRYQIRNLVPPAASGATASSQTSLETLIARTNKVIECKTERLGARAVFSQLVTELREVLKEGDEVKIKRATMFLLGALFHRYFRILTEDKGWPGFMARDPIKSDMFIAIREALQLQMPAPKDYETKDMKILDVTTIVDCLEVFQANMLLVDKLGKARYQTYPHFVQDTNFETHLKQIIDNQKAKGQPILNQFKAIQFVQSLADKLEADRVSINAELQKWSKILMKDHPEFKQLTKQMIEAHIKKHIQSPMQHKILDLLKTDFIESYLSKMDHKTFMEGMNTCYTETARYALLGGHALLLQTAEVKEQLTFCIIECLGVDKKSNDICDLDMLNGMKLLDQLIDGEPNIVLNCEFFGGKEKLKTELIQKIYDLSRAIEAKARATDVDTDSGRIMLV